MELGVLQSYCSKTHAAEALSRVLLESLNASSDTHHVRQSALLGDPSLSRLVNGTTSLDHCFFILGLLLLHRLRFRPPERNSSTVPRYSAT